MSSEKPPAYEPPQTGYPPPQGQPYPPPQGQPYPHPQGQPGGYQTSYGQPMGYQPQPAGYVGGTTVVVAQPMAGPLPGSTIRYTQSPALIVCQHCQATVTTSLSYEIGLLTWAAIGIICLFGCWLGCCLIPLCIDGLKDVEHRCPNCNNVVGRFRHFS